MTPFKIHNADTAPPEARPHLQKIQKTLGFIPNVHGVIGGSVLATEAMAALQGAVAKSGFIATELYPIQSAEVGSMVNFLSRRIDENADHRRVGS